MRIFNFRIYFFCFILYFLFISLVFSQSLLSTQHTLDTNDSVNDLFKQQETDFFLHPELEQISSPISSKFLDKFLNSFDTTTEYSVTNQQLILLLSETVELLSKSEEQAAFVLLKSFSATNFKKNALFESYFFLLSYLSFFRKNYQDNYIFSKEYLENFANYQGVYTIFYFHLYSALITNNEFVFEPIIRDKNFLSKIPKNLQNAMKRLVIEYAQIRGKYNLSTQYLKEADDKELILEIIANTYDPNFLKNYQKMFFQKQIREEIFFRQTQLFYLNRQDEQVQENLNKIFKNEQQYTKKIIKKFSRLEKQTQKEREVIKIGILLPFSTQSATIQNIIQQIETSINIFFGEHAKYYEFYFMDTALSAITTKKNYQKLVDKGVFAVIGPLARRNVDSILEQTNEAKIPVLSLTLSQNIGKNHPYIYRYQRNRAQENKYLANYAVDYLQAKNIVAFYDSETSLQDVFSFQKELKKKGSKFITIEKVTFDNLNIQNSFRNITGIYRYLNRYEAKIYEILQEQNFTPAKIDALYLPFNLEKILLIRSFLSSYGLQSAYLLANGSVNNTQIQNYNLPRFYFADEFFFDSQKLLSKKYKDYYLLTGSEEENLQIYGVIVYELLELIDQVVTKFDVQNPEKMKYYLDRINQYSFLNTPLKISKEGEISKEYNIYHLYKSKIFPIF